MDADDVAMEQQIVAPRQQPEEEAERRATRDSTRLSPCPEQCSGPFVSARIARYTAGPEADEQVIIGNRPESKSCR